MRWIANGTVASSLIAPLADSLLDSTPNLSCLGGCRVTSISRDAATSKCVRASERKGGSHWQKRAWDPPNASEAVQTESAGSGCGGTEAGSGLSGGDPRNPPRGRTPSASAAALPPASARAEAGSRLGS